MKPLTKRQTTYLDYITMYHQKHGEGLQQKQLMKHFKGSSPTIHAMVKRLIEYGCVTKEGPSKLVTPVNGLGLVEEQRPSGEVYIDDIIQEAAGKIVKRIIESMTKGIR